jgi:hypothetical protein
MTVATIGEALRLGWRIRVRCAWGKRDGMKSRRECVANEEFDLAALVWTRRADFPIARLESRMEMPALRLSARGPTFRPAD